MATVPKPKTDAPTKPESRPQNTKAASASKSGPSPAQAQAKDAFELVRLRNFYYRDGYRRLLSLVLVLALMLCGSVGWVYYLFTHRPAPRYFATNVHGGLIPLVPLTTPSMSDQSLINWAARAASSAFTLNYVQYRDQIENTKDTYFTSTGADQYQQQLISSNDLAAIVQGNFVVVAQPNAAPTIVRKGIEQIGQQQVYTWHVELPLLLSFHSQEINSQRLFDLQLTIVRSGYLVDNLATNLDGMRGIGISQLLARSMGVYNGT